MSEIIEIIITGTTVEIIASSEIPIVEVISNESEIIEISNSVIMSHMHDEYSLSGHDHPYSSFTELTNTEHTHDYHDDLTNTGHTHEIIDITDYTNENRKTSIQFIMGDGISLIRDTVNEEDMMDIETDRNITITGWTLMQTQPDDAKGNIKLNIYTCTTVNYNSDHTFGSSITMLELDGTNYLEQDNINWNIDQGVIMRTKISGDTVSNVNQITLSLTGIERN